MAIAVLRALSVRDGQLVEEGTWPGRFRIRDVFGVLTSLDRRGDGTGPAWELSVEIGKGASTRRVFVPLQPFLTPEEYRESAASPLSFSRLDAQLAQSIKGQALNRLWLYRETIYVTERTPQPSEFDEAVLRIKALHFQHDEGLKRLTEQVPN